MNPPALCRLPAAFERACERRGVLLTEYALAVSVQRQRLRLFVRLPWRHSAAPRPAVALVREMLISTSRFGVGQQENSQQTPLGLHRVAAKIGGGWPPGAVFKARQMCGYTWQGQPQARIVHRILWLAGLEPGFNQGGRVDSFRRYIYLHGFSDPLALGRPASHGCIHLGADDLLLLFDLLPVGTLVWIGRDW
ncbi:L,D-transpeptidase [Fontisphaera persica]|uniref:L,D-transpeptidase n=1 Tax=Fontisphaera persica TaxID=2974023 RepID=UPI0024C026DD|nr:L,D-transpeptidase [Fontisphaera persica]WCJ58730.1 L,D-transpeptidase [Fontisphaera persica]